MAKKLSRKMQVENLCLALFNLYLIEHGGTQNNPLYTILWQTGRVEELTKHLNEEAEGKR